MEQPPSSRTPHSLASRPCPGVKSFGIPSNLPRGGPHSLLDSLWAASLALAGHTCSPSPFHTTLRWNRCLNCLFWQGNSTCSISQVRNLGCTGHHQILATSCMSRHMNMRWTPVVARSWMHIVQAVHKRGVQPACWLCPPYYHGNAKASQQCIHAAVGH